MECKIEIVQPIEPVSEQLRGSRGNEGENGSSLENQVEILQKVRADLCQRTGDLSGELDPVSDRKSVAPSVDQSINRLVTGCHLGDFFSFFLASFFWGGQKNEPKKREKNAFIGQ
jgi:hypothetical protein